MTSRSKANPESDATSIAIHVPGIAASEGLVLVVVPPGSPPQTLPLSHGVYTLGRRSGVDIEIPDDSLSRSHARLAVSHKLELTDLESSNGTRVRDVRLEPNVAVEILPGETFELGNVMCVVQRRAPAGHAPRRVWNHGYFEGRLEEECERGGIFAVARIHIDGVITNAEQAAAIDKVFGSGTIVADYAPGEIEILFLTQDAEVAQRTCGLFASELSQHKATVVTSIVTCPRDGRTASSLLSAANARLDRRTNDAVDDEPVVAGAMERLRRLVDRVAKSDISIIIHGETGVGKEVMAKDIHKASGRATKPFVGINCAALTETLLESELFGHEKGAFSGALSMKPGLFEVASTGTVFLDEIGETSASMQAKLLRVLEEREVQRVGGLQPRAIDVRFIAASHRSLEEDVAGGRFREDLYYRLNGITLEIPPLRERPAEIEVLAESFVQSACRRAKRADVPEIGRAAMALLKGYAWPGNIRELKNTMERAVLLCADDTITAEHLPSERMRSSTARPTEPDARMRERTMITQPRAASGDFSEEEVTIPERGPIRDSLRDLEKNRILEVLQECGGNQTKAAKVLGIPRRTLLHRLDRYGVPRPRKPT